MPTILKSHLIPSTEIIERIFAISRDKIIVFISKSLHRSATVEDVEDIFIDSMAILWDKVLSNHDIYDSVIAEKILYGIIKKQFFIYRNNSMNKISIDFLETQHASNDDYMYNFEEDITDVPLYTPNEWYQREREKTPERREHHRKKSKRHYWETKSDERKYQVYKDRYNALRKNRRAAKKEGIFKDRRLLQNKFAV